MAARFTVDEVIEQIMDYNSDFEAFEDDPDESSTISESNSEFGQSEEENYDVSNKGEYSKQLLACIYISVHVVWCVKIIS